MSESRSSDSAVSEVLSARRQKAVDSPTDAGDQLAGVKYLERWLFKPMGGSPETGYMK